MEYMETRERSCMRAHREGCGDLAEDMLLGRSAAKRMHTPAGPAFWCVAEPEGCAPGSERLHRCPNCGYEDPGGDPDAPVHRCPRCGIGYVTARCPSCGGPGERLGQVSVPDRPAYIQYRCRRCGHGFMVCRGGRE